MIWWVKVIAGTGVVIVVIALLYVGYVFLMEKIKLDNAPREAMFQCQIHGWIKKTSLINFMGQDYCTQCYYDKQRQAAKIL